ncbi:hypothetical protein ACTFIW_005534 [Dictyostelium discoideum]
MKLMSHLLHKANNHNIQTHNQHNHRFKCNSSSNNNQQQPTTTNNQQQPTTTNNNQQQPTTNNNQQQPTTTNNNQQQPTTTNNNQHQPTTTTNEITNYPSKRMKPLHWNRILNSQLSYIRRIIICRFISLYYTERIVSFSGSAVVDSETSISGGGSNKFSLDRVSSIISKFPTSEELASIHKLHSMK